MADVAEVPFRSRPRNTVQSGAPVRHSVVGGVRTSKFRHVVASSGGKEGVFTNLRKVNTQLRPESNGFSVNDRWAAVPLQPVTTGLVAIFDLHKPMKIVDGVIPGLENGSAISDLAWCPFDQNTLTVACENGYIYIWKVPVEGVHTTLTTPEKSWKAHDERITTIRYNPVAADVLASAANGGVTIWDVSTSTSKMCLHAHDQPILSMAWSGNGAQIATVSRDCKLRIFNPRKSTSCIRETTALETPKAARVLFVCNDRFVLVSSFSKSSQRVITLYSAANLAVAHTQVFDNAASLMIPHYDADTSVLFLTGKGDRTIHMFEICDENPYFLQMEPFSAPSGHQAIGFASKTACNVKKVEFARGARLFLNNIELVSFTVPRVKTGFFQNDIFPPSLATWQPIISAAQWFSGDDAPFKYVDLKPADMEPLYKEIYAEAVGRSQCPNAAPAVTNGYHAVDSKKQEEKFEHRPTELNIGKSQANGAVLTPVVDEEEPENGEGDAKLDEQTRHAAATTIHKLEMASDGLGSFPSPTGSGDEKSLAAKKQFDANENIPSLQRALMQIPIPERVETNAGRVSEENDHDWS